MLFCSIKYKRLCLLQKIICVAIPLMFSVSMAAQNISLPADIITAKPLNPMLVSAYKKPAGMMGWHLRSPSYKKFVARRGGELMHWPSYPLTTGQIIARNEEWQRRNNPNIGEQIASDIIKSNVNRLIYGRKPVPAVIPKF